MLQPPSRGKFSRALRRPWSTACGGSPTGLKVYALGHVCALSIGGALLAIALASCGSSATSASAARRPAGADRTFAARLLTTQLTFLHRAVGGSEPWRQNGSSDAGQDGCSTDRAAHDGLTAVANSSTFVVANLLELRLFVRVFATTQAASRVLQQFSAMSHACVTHAFAAWLRGHGYRVGRAIRTQVAARADIGQGARAITVEIPTTVRGRAFTWNLDQSAVRQGRVIDVFSTLAGLSTVQTDLKIAAALAKIAAAAQQSRRDAGPADPPQRLIRAESNRSGRPSRRSRSRRGPEARAAAHAGKQGSQSRSC